MDPLSGNGIHEAVRSARVAVAAVNSYLRGEPWSVVARFVDERSRELWRRSVSAAADFYRLQADWSGSEFWTSTAAAYERAAGQAMIQVEGEGQFEMRPVLNGEQIELRRVWVSPDWPRGVWKVDGRSLEQTPVEQIPSLLRRAAGVRRQEV
jgi:flavin-dependent dehydrogenase